MHILIQEKFAYNCLAEAVWETQARGIIDPDFCNPYSFRRVAELQTKTRSLTLSSGIPGFYVAEWGKGAFYVARV